MATTDYTLAHAAASADLAPRTTVRDATVQFVRTKPLGAAGALIILFMIGVAFLADALAPYDPYHSDYGAQFSRPSTEHWFGTDEFGRDILSRIMHGARIALFVGFIASFTGCTVGALLGVISASPSRRSWARRCRTSWSPLPSPSSREPPGSCDRPRSR
jgi:peptide/nickel transport system permease protein